MNGERGPARAEEGREECLEALYRLERSACTITLELLRATPDLRGMDIPATLLELIERSDIELRQGTIALNRSGRLTGKRIYRRHEIAEWFLRLFGLRRERAHREACRLEHVMSLPGERRQSPPSHDELDKLFELFELGAVPLARGLRGVPYRVAMVCGGHGARRKLEDMGVSRGAQVELCGRQGRGPVEIAVRGSRLALGRGIASKVLVVPPASAGIAPTAGSAAGRRHRIETAARSGTAGRSGPAGRRGRGHRGGIHRHAGRKVG